MAPTTSKQFIIDKTIWKPSYTISLADDDAQHRKFVRITTIGSSPDVTIHDGPTQEAPILAVAHMTSGRADFKIGLGDPVDANSVVWEDLKHLNRIMTRYAWAMDLPLANDAPKEERKPFTWKRTRSVTADGAEMSALAIRNWKLVAGDDAGDGDGADADDGSDESADRNAILAVFTHSRVRGRAGVLQINVDHGTEFETMVMITLLSLFERARRAGGG